ncbi:hypothetical protein Bresa_01108|uniref:Uncharacterized protein n=1 Tax=Brenneria salicis ATCC 15712 = DSM 30166 TaxID=714314 RepID=A0A366IAK8_9GAMM|nr:hypothetical protein [Brenneria salicis ATCC 15712 = DSM 30166]RBP66480.1 hypothetical protein DES54_1037 [Brenneria salicis ATCC 15712 = DSM 30166]
MAYLRTRNKDGKILFDSDIPCYVLSSYGETIMDSPVNDLTWGMAPIKQISATVDTDYPPLIFISPGTPGNNSNQPAWNSVCVSSIQRTGNTLTFRIYGNVMSPSSQRIKYYIFTIPRAINNDREGVFAVWKTNSDGQRLKHSIAPINT